MKRIRVITPLAVLALILGMVDLPAQAAPAAKPTSPTADLADALKTMRPISVPLLEQDEVQTELKMTAEQKQAIADLIKSARDEFQAALRQPVALPAPGAAGAAAVRVITQRTIKYDTDKMAATLKPEQLVRLRQLELHLKGPNAFADRRVARVLNLTVQQDLKIEEVIMRYEPAFTEAMLNARLNGNDFKPLAELGEKFDEECIKLLTKEQKSSLDWLIGKRPDAAVWAKAAMPTPGGFGAGLAVQGGVGGIRIAPPIALPAAPAPAVPSPAPKKDDK